MNKKRSFVVDDESSNNRMSKLNLEAIDDHIDRAENPPAAALPAAESFPPDLILLNVTMPDMDGGNLACRFKASAKLLGLPIVSLTTAAKTEEVVSRGGRIGGIPFRSKAASLPEVIGSIEKHLVNTTRPK